MIDIPATCALAWIAVAVAGFAVTPFLYGLLSGEPFDADRFWPALLCWALWPAVGFVLGIVGVAWLWGDAANGFGRRVRRLATRVRP